jgi:hypothetical protein|tara:strand:- start:515 stop:640 length:126 start_codon:yes stop_codon:yes gene_type:complete
VVAEQKDRQEVAVVVLVHKKELQVSIQVFQLSLQQEVAVVE